MKRIMIIAIIIIAIAIIMLNITAKDNKNGLTVEPGVLKVGMDLKYPPFETFDKSNNPSGISVDVAKALAKYLGLKLEIKNMDFSTIIPGLETESIDIAIASMGYTEERDKKVDFTNPYFYFKMIGLMNKEYAIKNKFDKNTTSEELWNTKSTRFIGMIGQTSSIIPESHGFDVKLYNDKGSAVMDISQNKADMLIFGSDVVVHAQQNFPDTTEIFWSPVEVSPICMAVREGNTQLIEKANMFIKSMSEKDGVYSNLSSKYDKTIQNFYNNDEIGLDFYINEK